MKYALVENNAIIRIDGKPYPPHDTDPRWRQVVDNLPTVDTATQWLTQNPMSGWTINANSVEATYTVTDKTLAELQAEVTLDVLSVNRWTIPADGVTPVVVTYTATDTVHFVVDGTIYPVEPDDLHKATLEITAPEPGPIRVEVRDKAAVVITAEEVVA